MKMHRATGLILMGIVGTVLIVAFFVLPGLLNGNHYRLEAISYLEKSMGKKVEMRRLAVNFFPHMTIRVDDFGVKNPSSFPSGYLLKAVRIDARIEPWALLRHELVVESLVLDQPVINLISDPDGPWNFENPGANTGPGSFPIGLVSLVKIQGGHVLLSNLLSSDAPGPVFFEAREVFSELHDLNPEGIADPKSTTLDGEGTLQAGLVRLGAIEATHLESKIRLQSRQAVFTSAHAELYGGGVSGEFLLKFSGKNASFKTDATMKSVDMARLLSAFEQARGKMTGTMEGELHIAGTIHHSAHPLDALHGGGHVTIRNGQVPSLRLNANLMKLAHYNDLGPAKNDPSSFNLVSTDLELDHEQLSSKTIDIDGYGVDVDGSGSLSLSGSDELDYRGVAQIVTPQGFFTNLFARLAGATLKDGKLSFPFHIGGTIANPEFSKGK